MSSYKVQRKQLENELKFRKSTDTQKPIFLNLISEFIRKGDAPTAAPPSPRLTSNDYIQSTFNAYASSFSESK